MDSPFVNEINNILISILTRRENKEMNKVQLIINTSNIMPIYQEVYLFNCIKK